MRLYEFTNAEEQLGLLRVIIDNTWTAIAQQAKQQKAAEAQRKAKAIPRKAKGGIRMGKRVATPYQAPPKKLPTPQVQQANPKPTPIQTAIASHKPLPTAATNISQPLLPTNQATTPKDGYLG